jgi:hypothetical protein
MKYLEDLKIALQNHKLEQSDIIADYPVSKHSNRDGYFDIYQDGSGIVAQNISYKLEPCGINSYFTLRDRWHQFMSAIRDRLTRGGK